MTAVNTNAAATLIDLARAARATQVAWALIGGEALRAHGVPRDTIGIDAIVPRDQFGTLANALVTKFEWTPLAHDLTICDLVMADDVTIHEWADQSNGDATALRATIPLRAPDGSAVALRAVCDAAGAVAINAAHGSTSVSTYRLRRSAPCC